MCTVEDAPSEHRNPVLHLPQGASMAAHTMRSTTPASGAPADLDHAQIIQPQAASDGHIQSHDHAQIIQSDATTTAGARPSAAAGDASWLDPPDPAFDPALRCKLAAPISPISQQ
ncbi:hypothetical protein ACLOJK_036332 [Asimina triloba]